MNTPTRPRSTRDRPAKPPLSVAAIVDAALDIVRAEGLDAVSMRRVATALDTGAGSLYVYVDGRDGLVEAISDCVVSAIQLEAPDPRRWRSQLHTLVRRMRDALVAHPGLAAASIAAPPRTEATFGLVENMLALLLAGGLGAQDASWTADVLAALVAYTAIEAEARQTDASAIADDITANVARLAPERFPLLSAHVAQLVAGDADERFRFAIDVVLDGVTGRTPATRHRQRRKTG